MIDLVIERGTDPATYINKLMYIVMSQIWDQKEINQAFKGILKEQVQENACNHDAHNIS